MNECSIATNEWIKLTNIRKPSKMEDLELKYITKLAQIRKIIGDNDELRLLLLREFADDLGVVSISDYCEILGVKKRTIQYQIQNNKIDYLNIGGFRFPFINI